MLPPAAGGAQPRLSSQDEEVEKEAQVEQYQIDHNAPAPAAPPGGDQHQLQRPADEKLAFLQLVSERLELWNRSRAATPDRDEDEEDEEEEPLSYRATRW